MHGWGVGMAGGVRGRGRAWWWEGVHGEGDMVGSMHGRGVCMAGGVHGGGRGCMVRETWYEACMEGGVHGRGHAWWWERVHGEGDMVGGVHGRGCVWQGACMVVGEGAW